MMKRMLVCLLAASAGAYHLPASAKLQQGVKMTAPPPRAMAPAMKKGVPQEVQIDDGNGSRKYVDPASLLLTVHSATRRLRPHATALAASASSFTTITTAAPTATAAAVARH